MEIVKKILGIAPQLETDGSYSPSKLALKLATSMTTDYDGGNYKAIYKGQQKKILMLCTEDKNMTMKNGKKFSTGNHPVEMCLPMLHLEKAGFEIEVATPTGKEVKVEQWAIPREDKNVISLLDKYKNKFSKPLSFKKSLSILLSDFSYAGIFIPGGHGAMLGLPEDDYLAKILYWANDNDKYTLAICHGPAALLAAEKVSEKTFLYNGYKIAAFPDSVDKQTPMIGYMPGHMPWKFGEKLENKGVQIINNKADKTCHVDRKLITGASPQAANDFGRLAASTLLENLK